MSQIYGKNPTSGKPEEIITDGTGALAVADASVVAKLDAINTTLKSQQDLEVDLFTDDTGTYFYGRTSVDGDTGAISIAYVDLAGTAYTPGTNVRPAANERNYSQQVTLYDATAAGTGFAVGDVVARVVVLNNNKGAVTVMSSGWLNITQGTVLASAPTMANLNEQGDDNPGIGKTTDAAATDGTSAWSLVALLKGIWALLNGRLKVGVPGAASAVVMSATTAAVGANYTAFGNQTCTALDVVNMSGTAIEYQRGGAGATVTILSGSSRLVVGITNANQVGIRRVDQSNTQVAVSAEAITA